MNPDLSKLDAYIEEADVDGYLIEADGETSDQRYLSGFTAPDPFVTLYTGETHLLVSALEYGRAQRTARADSVARHTEYDHRENIAEYGPTTGKHRTLAAFLDAHGVESVAVPEACPAGTADGLREQGVVVDVDYDGVVQSIRATKTDAEIDNIRAAQRANEAAMARAESLLEAAAAEDGTLLYDGEPLTSERVKREIEIELLRQDCALDETIVACGRDAADPHDRGSGPLEAGEPIIVDIFPRSKETGYHADMTRTFCVGEPDETVEEWYDLTHEAQQAALDAIEAGASGSEVHAAVCEVYEAAGEPTLRSDPETETGFIHTTGHGVGLDVHESPRVSEQDAELKPGHIITVEPGLYDPTVGGVRIEDLVVVTEDGYENLTDYEKQLVVGDDA
ncbi:peptidase M24 family protein (homolog to Xaa-Pro dipeptidase) [Natronomonas pharaonis DSM 2160]|uniref:Peptidase M24 family protein (Homolog to Xaa-Pro dipeptidase) n=1 Tax=Natronomonas pharaonis (strain ATCC 35678 / DSM 2160 / CIP 103997 / JCM 8858 / NBRC 14720 / NCIMB 2260 / Gabara) TaxID=348780 RepID=A0A1U7EWZ0_NATPD|nr:Xaa-Pro peptidase family protein [Natronomonas pharaonis]CAI49629.1 peptidase M24 family protein (homolog to Xaa-Pro dipeptidase) [Natronomonas pharaonis DSM 2160]